jgi:hypothetical protein
VYNCSVQTETSDININGTRVWGNKPLSLLSPNSSSSTQPPSLYFTNAVVVVHAINERTQQQQHPSPTSSRSP